MSESSMVACARCSAETDPRHAIQSSIGLLCAECENADAMEGLWEGASAKLLSSAASSVGLGVISIFFNPCLLMSALGVGTGFAALASLSRNPEYRPRLGWRLPVVVVLSLLGMGLSIVGPIAVRLLLVAAGAR